MATGAGNLYPNWLGTASLTIPNNQVNTTVNVQGIGSYTTPVQVVPQILLSSISTAVLDTNNPSEILSFTVPASGWYQTTYNATASHASVADWTNMSQLVWNVKKNNGVLSNTQLLVKPKQICGASVSEFITISGSGVFPANAGDLLEWQTDADPTTPTPITSNYFSGFNCITIQKIG